MRVDIKNMGSQQNSVSIEAPECIVTQPAWFTNAQGIGQIAENFNLTQRINITAKGTGNLRLYFRGSDMRARGKRFPLWIDYNSIKIDGREVLSCPVTTWHDKPFRYEQPIVDGQLVIVEIEQVYHAYNKIELLDTIVKLLCNFEYAASYAKKVARYVRNIIRENRGKL